MADNVDVNAGCAQTQELSAWQVDQVIRNGIGTGVDLKQEGRRECDTRQADVDLGGEAGGDTSVGHRDRTCDVSYLDERSAATQIDRPFIDGDNEDRSACGGVGGLGDREVAAEALAENREPDIGSGDLQVRTSIDGEIDRGCADNEAGVNSFGRGIDRDAEVAHELNVWQVEGDVCAKRCSKSGNTNRGRRDLLFEDEERTLDIADCDEAIAEVDGSVGDRDPD